MLGEAGKWITVGWRIDLSGEDDSSGMTLPYAIPHTKWELSYSGSGLLPVNMTCPKFKPFEVKSKPHKRVDSGCMCWLGDFDGNRVRARRNVGPNRFGARSDRWK